MKHTQPLLSSLTREDTISFIDMISVMLGYFSKPNVKSFLILLISEFSIKAWKGKHWRTKTKLSRKGKWTKTEKKCCSSVVQLHQISHEDLVTSRYHPDRFVAPTIHRWKENEHSHGRAHLKPLSQRKLQACPDFGHFLRDLNLPWCVEESILLADTATSIHNSHFWETTWRTEGLQSHCSMYWRKLW